ncbi:MAG: SUMF1/EgtB/PvdO family nonheme iron enzyme [Polyangiaceae bacterium]
MLAPRARTLALLLVGSTISACHDSPPGDDRASKPAVLSATGSVAVSASAAASASGLAPSASAALTTSASAAPTAVPACPADMVLVTGLFCPEVEERCKVHTREWDETEKKRAADKAAGKELDVSHVSERCLRYEPSKCLSHERRPMRFCIDKYEWPNKAGEKPAFMVTWGQAKDACSKANKRLCTADEFTFACEGEEISPYSYGLERDKTACNIDKPYVTPKFKPPPYDICLKSTKCKAHMDELDQREPAGSRPGCGSPFGAMDLNGNVNEWVERPKERAPWRSGLKGGWWGPSRARCRPMVTAHNENYVGYEVGFRCCAAATLP